MIPSVENDWLFIFDPYMGPLLGVMAIKGYSTFPKAPGLGPHYQTVYSYTGHSWEAVVLLPLQKCSRRILQPLSTGLYIYIYPTPPLGQDMTQGQFLSGV